MLKRFFSVIIAIILTFGLCSCGKVKDNSIKTTTKWEMSEEAKAYCEYYNENGISEYFVPGQLFNDWLSVIIERGKEAQTISDDIILSLTNKPTVSKYNNENVYTMSKDNYDKIVLYIHGGAYVEAVTSAHVTFCDALVDTLNAKVCLPLYPLAPQYTFEAAYSMIDALYKDLLMENKPIYIMGDSAGGGFTLAFTQYLIANDIKVPEKIVMLSPWLDITSSNPEMKEYEKTDVNLAVYGTQVLGKLWAGETDVKDYRLSPIYGNLSNLPDMAIFVCDSEIMYPDVIRLYNSVSNTNVQLIVGEGYFHGFPIYRIPERQKALNLIYDFCK